MLALMPQTPPTTDFHATSSLTMSLAVLPHSPASLHSSSFPQSCPSIQSAAPSRRPKLSLNTTSLPTSLGKSTTALRVETLSVASPTSRNTFQNAFGPSGLQGQNARPPASRMNPPTPLRTSSTDSITSSVSSNSATSADSYATSASSTDSMSPPVPYRLPYNAKSILTNGPLPRVRRRKSFTTTRPMFPSTKKVSFRAQLTEEIRTEKYTMAHIDLESDGSSVPLLRLPPQLVLRGSSGPAIPMPLNTDVAVITESPTEMDQDSDRSSQPRSPHVGDKRESSDEEDDSDTCPSTPISRHSKRRREWVWTLGPIKPQMEDHSVPSSSPAVVSNTIEQSKTEEQ